MADAHKNFAYSTVATAPSPASSGLSLVVAAGEGTRFPATPFNATVWPIGTLPLPSNAEIVRVTNITSDTLTIVRTQESTSARSIIVGDQISATITAKTLTDIENLLIANTIGTAKGSIIAFSASGTPIEVTVGSNTTVLQADSSQSAGVKWASVPSDPLLYIILKQQYK